MKGKIFIVGIGPGSFEMMTVQAQKVIEASDIVVGYTVYVDLLKNYFPQKQFLSTPMKQEIERCRICFNLAREGKTVAMVSSGDAGVYGMASPMYEVQHENNDWKEIELAVVPGITAANSGAAVLGSPLNHDYCVISLSDLLTPWETIEKRIKAAVEGDFAIALYNPSSHKRKDYLKKACNIMLAAGASEERKCGYVKNIGRNETEFCTCTLSELKDMEVDMFTTVFVGNSQTEVFETESGKRLITKRGYSV